MGRRLIEHTLPEIARQLARVADALETNKGPDELTQLKIKYKTLSELDADHKSTHRMNRKVREQMGQVLAKIKTLEL
jgi:hypothetical protein